MTSFPLPLEVPDDALDRLAGLRGRLPGVVDAAVGRLAVHRPSGPAARAGREAVRDAVTRQYELVLAERPWTAADLERLARPMRLLGRAGVAHGRVRHAVEGVQYATHRAWWQVADQTETGALVALTAWSKAHGPALVRAFERAYRDGLAGAGSLGALRTATCRALLDGGAVPDGRTVPDLDPDLALAVTFAVLVVLAHDEVAARAAHRALEGDGAVLACAAGDTVSVLVPAASATEAGLRELLGRIGAVRRVAVVDDVPRDDLPRAHTEAGELLALARAANDPRRVVRAGDLELDTLAARRRLAGLDRLLHPLDGELLHTVDVLYRNDLDRSRTAAALFVHRNTVDYRLRRITTLTGISPVSVRGIQLYATALTRHRLAGPGDRPDGPSRAGAAG